MGIVSKLLSFIERDAKVDRGGGDNITARHFSAPGDDSAPVAGDWCCISEANGTGRQSAVGYYDAKNAPKSAPGEKRIYGRDASGEVVSEVWLKNDRSVTITNGAGLFTMGADGLVIINGVAITPNGDVILANGIVVGEHKHSQGKDSGGDTQVDTDGPKI